MKMRSFKNGEIIALPWSGERFFCIIKASILLIFFFFFFKQCQHIPLLRELGTWFS